jgi:calcium/proton exchanger cax
MPRWFYVLLIFSVAAPLLAVFHVPPLLLFPLAGLGILPLAALIGTSVEHIAEHTGEQVGGILFATFGKATELTADPALCDDGRDGLCVRLMMSRVLLFIYIITRLQPLHFAEYH